MPTPTLVASRPAKLIVSAVVNGDVDATVDVVTLGEQNAAAFDPSDVVAGIIAGDIPVDVRADFYPDGAPSAEVTEKGNVRITWTGLKPEAFAERRLAALTNLAEAFHFDADSPVMQALVTLHDAGIELKWLVAEAPSAPAKATGRGVPSDFKWELGRTYTSGDDSMVYAAPAQFVHDGITFNSASAAARYCVAKRDGNAGSDDSKYNRNGKTFWK
jgi:hypothetical protein